MHRDALPEDGAGRLDLFRRMMDAVAEAAQRIGAAHVVLSSEYLWGRLPPPLLAALAEALAPYETRIAAILRRQDSWFEASYLQAIKSGLAQEFDAWIEKCLAAPLRGGGDALAVLEFWERGLAPTALAVRPYEFEDRTRFTIEALDFVCGDAVGADMVGAEAKFVNPSPNRAGLSALLAVNRQTQAAAEDRRKAAQRILGSMIRPARSGDAIVLTRDRASRLMEGFAASNRRLAARFGDGTRETYFDMADLHAPEDEDANERP